MLPLKEIHLNKSGCRSAECEQPVPSLQASEQACNHNACPMYGPRLEEVQEEQAADRRPSMPTALQTNPHLQPAMAQQVISATAKCSAPHLCSANLVFAWATDCPCHDTGCSCMRVGHTSAGCTILGLHKRAWLPWHGMTSLFGCFGEVQSDLKQLCLDARKA